MQYDNKDYLKPIGLKSQKDNKGFNLKILYNKGFQGRNLLICNNEIIAEGNVAYLKRISRGYLHLTRIKWKPVF